MKQSLNLNISQHIAPTSQLKQSLRLLEFPSDELEHEFNQFHAEAGDLFSNHNNSINYQNWQIKISSLTGHDKLISDSSTPDVLITKNQSTWRAELNPDNQCRLSVNAEYANLLKSKIDHHSSEYIQTNLGAAKICFKSLVSRYDTLLLVARVIVEHQSEFFDFGKLAMKPLNLSDIAQQLKLRKSTISRAISGKYLIANDTVYELKYFFSSALASKYVHAHRSLESA